MKISFNCSSCDKDNIANLSDLINLTPMGSSGVSADINMGMGRGNMMATEFLSGLGAFASGRIPNSVALYCKHCNSKNIISLP